MNDALTSPENQDEESNEIELEVVALTVATLVILARGLKKTKKMSYSEALAFVPVDEAKLERLFSATAERVGVKSYDALATVALKNDDWAKVFYEAAEVEQVAAAENAALSAIVNQHVESMATRAKAKINSSVVGLLNADGTVSPIKDWYINHLTEGINAMTQSAEAHSIWLAKTTDQMTRSGVRILKDSYRSQEIYSAIRQDFIDNYTSMLQELRNEQAKEFGADGVEISAHATCAPDHLPFQGRRMSNAKFKDLQNNLERPIGEFNCRHMWSPIILGVGSSNSEQYLAELERQSNGLVTFKGVNGQDLTMTRYEATQYQRKIETQIRKARVSEKVLEAAGQDTSDYTEFIKRREATYINASKSAGLRARLDRTKISLDD